MKYNSQGFYTSELLEQHALNHGFGTRVFDPASSIFPSLDGRGKGRVIIPNTKQIHSNIVTFFDSSNLCHSLDLCHSRESGNPELDPRLRGDDKICKTFIGDAWLTDVPGIVCLVRTADCLPILIYDPRNKIVGAIHAGWRGTAAHIVKETISKLFTMGSRPEDIIAVLGPRIMGNCYTVGDDVMAEFAKNGWNNTPIFIVRAKPLDRLGTQSRTTLSLSRAVKHELSECGLKPVNIDSTDLCTFCEPDKFHSHRRSPSEEGRQANFISLPVRR